MADEETGLFGRLKRNLKESVRDTAGQYGSIGAYYKRKAEEKEGLYPDEEPMTFRKQLSQDLRRGAASKTGAIGRAVFNTDGKSSSSGSKKNSSDSATSSDNRTNAELSGIKQQNSNINYNLGIIGSKLKKIDDALEDMLLSQERIEVAVNRLLYKKDPPPVVQQTVNNNTYNTVNNNTTNAGGMLGGGGGGGSKKPGPGRIPGGRGRAITGVLGALGLGSMLGGLDGGDDGESDNQPTGSGTGPKPNQPSGGNNSSNQTNPSPTSSQTKKFAAESSAGPQLNPTTYKYWNLNNPEALGGYYRLSDQDKIKANELALTNAQEAEKFIKQRVSEKVSEADLPAPGAIPTQGVLGNNDSSSLSNLAFAGLGVAADVAGTVADIGGKPEAPKSNFAGGQTPKTPPQPLSSTATTSKWAKFLSFIEKKSPNLFAKVGGRLASMGAGMTIPGPGWIWTAVNVLGTVSLAWDVYELWKEFNGQILSEDKRPNKVGKPSDALSRDNKPPAPPSGPQAAPSAGGAANNMPAASTNTSEAPAANNAAGSDPYARNAPALENNPSSIRNGGGPPNVQAGASGATPGLNQVQPMKFSGSNSEAFAKMEQAAKAAGSPDPKVTAAIAMLESGWLKSSMTQRANNPFGQTITQSQIGKDGIVGGTRGADGQLHAVYDSLESAVKHHVRRWGGRYSGDAQATLRNLVAGGYNTVNPTWASKVYSIYSGSAANTAGGGNRSQAPADQGAPAGRPGRSQGPSDAGQAQGTGGRSQGPLDTGDMSGTGGRSQAPTDTGGPQGTPDRSQAPSGPISPMGTPNRQQGPTDSGGRDVGGGMTQLRTPSGKTYTVASQYAKNFEGFVNELEGSGYRITSIGGYANRSTASGGFSWHSKGMAIDINPSQNPHTFPGSQNYGKTDMPSNVSAMAAKYGLGWGGNWKSSKDTMHFSMGGNEGGTGNEARGGQMASGESEGKGSAGGGGAGGYQPSPGGVAPGSQGGQGGMAGFGGMGAMGMLGGRGMMGGGIGGMIGSMLGLGGMGGMLGGRGGMMGMPGMGGGFGAMGMMGGRGMMMGGGLGGIGGMVGSMLGGRAGPMGSMLGGMLGSTLGNIGQSFISQPVNTGSSINTRSTDIDMIERQGRRGPTIISPQDNRTFSTPSERRFGSSSQPSATPGGAFAEVLASGIAGALVESLGSNSVSVNRRRSSGSMVS